jgi:UDP-N-acetylmuramate: L-alanyl-gamma-D-glutamyl-meso-diaminopimelate ligase
LGWDAQELFASLGTKASCMNDLAAMVRAIVEDARAGDHVLVMSNGGFGGLHGKLLEALAAKGSA